MNGTTLINSFFLLPVERVSRQIRKNVLLSVGAENERKWHTVTGKLALKLDHKFEGFECHYDPDLCSGNTTKLLLVNEKFLH